MNSNHRQVGLYHTTLTGYRLYRPIPLILAVLGLLDHSPNIVSQTQTLNKYISYIVLKRVTTIKKFDLEKSGVTSLVKWISHLAFYLNFFSGGERDLFFSTASRLKFGYSQVYGQHCFYRAMHFSANARYWDRMSSVRPSVRPSVCPSVTLVICDHIGWKS